MKKTLILIGLFLTLIVSPAWATWTFEISELETSPDGHNFTWKIVCTSDGAAQTSIDILKASTYVTFIASNPTDLLRKIRTSRLLVMMVEPGTGAVLPDAVTSITLARISGKPFYVNSATFPAVFNASSNYDSMHTLYKQYPPVGQNLYFTGSDIGDSGDQITLYIDSWIEK